jgi:hypothetical protein
LPRFREHGVPRSRVKISLRSVRPDHRTELIGCGHRRHLLASRSATQPPTSLNSGHHQPLPVGDPVCLRHPGLPTSTTCRGRHSGRSAQRSTGCQRHRRHRDRHQILAITCPYHSKDEWRRLKRDHPDLFDRACRLETHLNQRRRGLGKDDVWLTRHARPLTDTACARAWEQAPAPPSRCFRFGRAATTPSPSRLPLVSACDSLGARARWGRTKHRDARPGPRPSRVLIGARTSSGLDSAGYEMGT